MTGRPLVIVGASGVGKTTVVTELLSRHPEFSYVRSATTRQPRGDGHDGEYIYVSREEFLSLVDRDGMLEYMEYGDNLYGTPRSELSRIAEEGKRPLLILDITGAESVRKKKLHPSPVILYLWDDINVIERRLYDRELNPPTTEGFLSFMKRKNANVRDYLSMREKHMLFDAFVRNTTVDECVRCVMALYTAIDSGENIGENNADTAEALARSAEEKNR